MCGANSASTWWHHGNETFCRARGTFGVQWNDQYPWELLWLPAVHLAAQSAGDGNLRTRPRGPPSTRFHQFFKALHPLGPCLRDLQSREMARWHSHQPQAGFLPIPKKPSQLLTWSTLGKRVSMGDGGCTANCHKLGMEPYTVYLLLALVAVAVVPMNR